MKIYKVIITAAAPQHQEIRAVRAANKAQAIHHAAKLHITASVATQDDSVEFGTMGIAIEDANADTPDAA
jgi:hypothetical protein